jgi:hypothetical protein
MHKNPPESNDEPKGSEQRPLFGAMRGHIQMQEGWEKPFTSAAADAFWEAREPNDHEDGERLMGLDEIVTKLDERKQRATYGAVAGILGASPRSLMAGRPRSPKYSWVVAKTGSRRGWPTDYTNEQIHPDCLRQIRDCSGSIIEDPEALTQWFKS